MLSPIVASWSDFLSGLGWLAFQVTVISFAVNVLFMLAMLRIVSARRVRGRYLEAGRPAPSFVKASILYYGLISGSLRFIEVALVLLAYCVPVLSWYLAAATSGRALKDLFCWMTGRRPTVWPAEEYPLERDSWLDVLREQQHKDLLH